MKNQTSARKNFPVSHTPRAPHISTNTQRPAPTGAAMFRVAQPYEGFHVGQTVFLYQGPTYGVDVPGEISVTVAPNQGPFVGMRPEFLERVTTH